MKEVKKLSNNRVEISKTSTGKVSYSVKVYGDTPEEIDTQLKELIKLAELHKAKLEF